MIWLKSVYGSRPSAMRVSLSRADAKIARALDVDRGEIHRGRRIGQEVPQVVDDAGIERLRQVGAEMAQLAVGAAAVDEVRRRLEEHVLEIVLGPDHLAELVEVLGLAGHDGVPEAEGGAGEFKRDARIDAGIVAGVGRDRVVAEQAAAGTPNR